MTAFPAGINAAATFDRGLMKKRGEAMGQEFRGKGVHVALGPAMNFARAPEAGRQWESFGDDPYLQGEAAYETTAVWRARRECAFDYRGLGTEDQASTCGLAPVCIYRCIP